MKPSLIFPITTAILGFSLGWLLKPTPQPASEAAGKVEVSSASARPTRTTAAEGERASSRSGKSIEQLHPLPAYTPESADDAKMLRLAELLGLTQDQQTRLKAAIEEITQAPSTTENVLQDMIARGNALEVAISQILSQEQLDQFEQLRQRERDNRTEGLAQKTLGTALTDVDLTPDQRKEVLSRLRQYTKEQVQSVPASAALLLESSILPVGDRPMSAEGLLTLSKMGEAAPETTDPDAFMKEQQEKNRASAQRLLECFEGILSPAQMAQYQLAMAKKQALFDQLPDGN